MDDFYWLKVVLYLLLGGVVGYLIPILSMARKEKKAKSVKSEDDNKDKYILKRDYDSLAQENDRLHKRETDYREFLDGLVEFFPKIGFFRMPLDQYRFDELLLYRNSLPLIHWDFNKMRKLIYAKNRREGRELSKEESAEKLLQQFEESMGKKSKKEKN